MYLTVFLRISGKLFFAIHHVYSVTLIVDFENKVIAQTDKMMHYFFLLLVQREANPPERAPPPMSLNSPNPRRPSLPKPCEYLSHYLCYT